MQLFKLEGPGTPWADYGALLWHGMAEHLGRDVEGRLQLERTGPFVPPITFPAISGAVVTDRIRQALLRSNLLGFSFAPVRLARIVDLDWSGWDRESDDPPVHPESGEPEDYILERAHSPALAAQMGPMWEVVLQEGAEVYPDFWALRPESVKGLDWFRVPNRGWTFVSPQARAWIE